MYSYILCLAELLSIYLIQFLSTMQLLNIVQSNGWATDQTTLRQALGIFPLADNLNV